MILSHKYRFIFLKNNKCAGSSVEIALSRFLGPDDVITPLPEREEAIRKELGNRCAQNYLIPKEYLTLPERLQILAGKPPPRFLNHIRARELIKRVDPEIWDSYFKFTIVRNPWDRVASLHYHRARDGLRTTLEKSGVFRDNSLRRLNDKGWGLYTIDNQIVVDDFIRYENLAGDLERIRQKLGMPEPLVLPKAKIEMRKHKGPENYMRLFSEEQKQRIATCFRREIEHFNYSCGPRRQAPTRAFDKHQRLA